MNFITEYKPLVEFIYFLSGPLLLIGLAIAAIQLRLFRQEAENRFKRETILLSLSSLENRIRVFVSLQAQLWDKENTEGSVSFEGDITALHTTGISCTNNWEEWIESEDTEDAEDVIHAANNLLNEIESFSYYIYSGITDEELCFRLEGEHILSYIEDNKHYLAKFRKSASDPVFSGVAKLYEDWSNKVDHNHLVTERNKIDSDLQNIRKPNQVKIIGTNPRPT